MLRTSVCENILCANNKLLIARGKMDFEARGKPIVKNIVELVVKNICQGNL